MSAINGETIHAFFTVLGWTTTAIFSVFWGYAVARNTADKQRFERYRRVVDLENATLKENNDHLRQEIARLHAS